MGAFINNFTIGVTFCSVFFSGTADNLKLPDLYAGAAGPPLFFHNIHFSFIHLVRFTFRLTRMVYS